MVLQVVRMQQAGKQFRPVSLDLVRGEAQRGEDIAVDPHVG